jgi:N-formylglutamate deformylase
MARAQGRRLAARRALRFCRAARRDIGANTALTLDHRRQSRSKRSFALSRSGDDGTRPRPCKNPTTTFDGEALYRPGLAPDAADIADRRRLYFDPYHTALAGEIARLRQKHRRVALFDAHSIRSIVPRLFDGELPVFNLGANSGASCDPRLRETIGAVLAASGQTSIVDGRFKGGWITRAHGRPSEGVEAMQLELACRAYMQEPDRPAPENWPTPIDDNRAAPTRTTIMRLLETILSEVSGS